MAQTKVRLPSGADVTIEHKEGASQQDVLSFAFDEYVVNQDPGTVIGRSIAQGIDNLQQAYGSTLEGIGNVLDAESLQQLGGDIVAKNQAQIDARRFREQESITDREGVAGAFDYVAELAGQSAPQMVTTFAGAGAGAAIGGAIGSLGGPLAPLTVPIGTFAGGFLANMPYFYGSNRERQKEAIEKGYKVEVDEGAAALAAIPQSALDAVFATVARAGVKFLGTPKMKLQGGILTKATLAAGGGSIVEAPTEIGQTVLERYQAGLPLDNDEALKEIVAAGVGGAVLGGLFGGAGGAVAGIRTPKETKAVEEKEQGQRQTFTVNYTNESTGVSTSTEVEADNEQQAQEIVNKSLNKTAREGTVVVQRPVEPEPVPTPEPVVEKETAPEPTPEPVVEPETVVEEEVTPEPVPEPEPVVEVDNEAIKEQQDIIDDADSRVFDLQSEIEIEKSNIKEARANTKKDIANVRKSNLSKEDKAERVEDLKAELQDTIDDINGNIDIYKEEMSEFKRDLRKAKKKLAKLQPPEVTAGAAPVTGEAGSVALTQKEVEFFNSFLDNKANREELLEAAPSLSIVDGKLSVAEADVDNLNNFVSDVGISDGLGTVPPRLKTAKFYRPFFVSEPKITSDEVLTNEQVQRGVESEHGATIDEDIDGDVFAGAAPVPPLSQQDAPTITRASLAGKKLFAYFSDRTKVGTYTGINPDSGININLQGGPMYPFMGNNKEKGAGWAFTTEGMFTRFLNRVKKTDGIGLVTLYSKENLRANLTFLKAYVAEVNYAIEQGTITEGRFLEVANELRKSAVQSKRKTGKSLDKPFKSIEDFEKGLADTTFDVRANAFFGYNKNKKGDNKGSKIGSDALAEEGFPNISTMVDLFADPSLDGLENGTIVSAVQFDQNQEGPSTATALGVDEHLSYKVVIKGEGLGFFSDPVLVSDVIPAKGRPRRAVERSAETSMADVQFQPEVVAATSPVGGQGEQTASQAEASRIQNFIEDTFGEIVSKIGTSINVNPNFERVARYNASTGVIEINPARIVELQAAGQIDIVDDAYIKSVMREEMIHAAMSKVIAGKAKGKKEGEAFQSFMSSLGKSLTPEQRAAIAEVYSGLETDAQFGAEYSRAAIQQLLYGDVTESFITQGPAFTKLKNLLRSVQSYLARTFGADVTTDPEAAGIIRASAELLQAADPNARPTNQKVVDESLAYSASVNPNAEVTSQEVAESGKPPSQKKLNINFARKYLFTLSSLLNSIHPRLKRLVRDYYGAIQGRVLNYQTRVAPFFKKHKGIKNEKDKRRIKQLLLYSPPGDPDADPLVQEQNRLLRKYDMLNDYNLEVRPVFDELRADLIDKGIEVGYLPDYMARAIKDLDKVKNRSGNELNEAFENYIDQRNKEIKEAESLVTAFELNPKDNEKPTEAQYKLVGEVVIEIGSDRTAAFEAQQWDVFTLGTKPGGGSNLPGNLKERTAFLRDVIPDDLLDAYEDPSVAMERYIFSVVSATESIKLVGRKFMAQGDKIEVPKASNLGVLIQELRANGEISNENADGTVPDIFRMILTPQQGENIFLQLSRTFGYGTLLVEFTSTLSQLYDLPFIMLDNGVLGTAGAMFGQRLKGEDFGIDTQQVSAEFAGDNRALEKAVRLGLKATGFTKLDQIMKETNLTANYNRYRKLSRGYYKNRNSANSKKFVAELTAMGYSEQEQVQLIADLKKGNRNSAYIRSLLFNKLAETQPLTQAEMALGIVNNPNLRLFVAMKSFMVSQLNFFKDRIILNMFGPGRTTAQRVQASKDLALLLTFLVMAGLPVDALKDFLAGRIGYMSDYLFNGIFRIAGISRYTAYQARKEGIGQATLDFVTPVAIQQFVDITSEMGRVATGQKAITESKFVTLLPFSDVINRIFGFQKERERREYMRRAREGERPFLIPAGAI